MMDNAKLNRRFDQLLEKITAIEVRVERRADEEASRITSIYYEQETELSYDVDALKEKVASLRDTVSKDNKTSSTSPLKLQSGFSY